MTAWPPLSELEASENSSVILVYFCRRHGATGSGGHSGPSSQPLSRGGRRRGRGAPGRGGDKNFRARRRGPLVLRRQAGACRGACAMSESESSSAAGDTKAQASHVLLVVLAAYRY